MADFNFFLNRQGVRGNKGEQGEQGYSPRITVKTETAAEYVLNVQNEDGSFDTPNLRGNAIENLGGTYVRFNQDTEQMYTGYADTASTTSQGEVTLSTYEDLESGGDESEVTTSKDVHDFVEAKISEASVNYVDMDDYTQKMGELDSAISDLDENKLDFTGLVNSLDAGTNITITPNPSTGKIVIAGEPVSQAQADWNQTDTDAPDYIKNKPVIDVELSSTSTNAVQNRLVTNAINLISNEFENYATNKLDNLLTEGEARLHALKAYSDNGEILTDTEGLSDITKYAHSSFDSSKFDVVGSPTISEDGVASGFSSGNYLSIDNVLIAETGHNYIFKGRYKHLTNDFTGTGYIFNILTTSGDYFGVAARLNPKTLSLVNSISGTTEWINANTLEENQIYDFEVRTDFSTYLDFYVGGELKGSKTYSASTSPRNTNVTLGRSSSGAFLTMGSLDLKQFSITVDGVPVFSGNKTGIDTIKPDDYTILGDSSSVVITDDGILKQSYATTTPKGYPLWDSSILPTPDGKHIYRFEQKWSINNNTVINYFMCIPIVLVADAIFAINSRQDKYIYLSVSNGVSNIAIKTSKQINTNTIYNTVIETDFTTFLRCLCDGEIIYENMNYAFPSGYAFRSLASFSCYYALLVSNYDFSGENDLNAFKIYVDGNLVYQPCLKIPYTKGSEQYGGKYVNAQYLPRVKDAYKQGLANDYFTLDEVNGTYTLPMGNLYGMIEKAASTVPSGVVQSSTIRNIVSLTQAEYDALTTKDSNTFYVITPST